MALRAIELAEGSVRTRFLMVGGSNCGYVPGAGLSDNVGFQRMVPAGGFEPPTL